MTCCRASTRPINIQEVMRLGEIHVEEKGLPWVTLRSLTCWNPKSLPISWDMAKAAFWKKSSATLCQTCLVKNASRPCYMYTAEYTFFFSSLSSPNSHMQHFAEPKKVKSQVVVHSILHRSKNCSWRRSAMMPRWLSPTACLTKTRRTWLAEHVGICRKITVVLDSLGHCGSISGWWFQTFFIFHNIWDNPSH